MCLVSVQVVATCIDVHILSFVLVLCLWSPMRWIVFSGGRKVEKRPPSHVFKCSVHMGSVRKAMRGSCETRVTLVLDSCGVLVRFKWTPVRPVYLM